jgi:hypothetical protein
MKEYPALTEEELKEVIAKLDRLCNESNTDAVTNIYEYQRKHVAYMGSNYSRYMNQFEMYFSALVDVGLNINYLDKKAWPKNRGLQFILATHSLKQFFSAYNLLNNGSYEDSIALLRSVYESFLRIIFISLNPKHSANIYKIDGQTGVKFNATGLIIDELKLDWNNYHIMSVFTHSNMFNVLETVTKISKGQKEAVTLDYKLSEDMISLVMNYMNFLMVVFLKLFSEVFTIDYSGHKGKESIKKHFDLLREYADTASVALKGHSNNKYWRQVGHDVDSIFELIHFMDENPKADWKKKWNTIYSGR